MTAESISDLAARRVAEAAATSAHLGHGDLLERLAAAGAALAACYRHGGKLIVCGNGGSAAQATHLAAELVGRYLRDRPALAAVALTDNAASLSAISNDYGYEDSFARQVEAHLRPGDAVMGLTTSGRSPNVLAALALGRERGAVTVGLGGRESPDLAAVCDHLLLVPSDDTPRIQEAHLVLGHTLCEIVEHELFPR